jgi:uncharacterized protein YqgV (UPF0045/DUF77 family)
MDVTVEISLHPLRADYEEIVIDCIAHLKKRQGIELIVNPTATHVYGPIDVVFDALKQEVSRTFKTYGKSVFVLKILNGNLKDSLMDKNL